MYAEGEDLKPVFIRRLLFIGVIICVVLAVAYEIGSAVFLRQTTGILRVNSPGAFLTVEQNGDKLVNIGISRAKIRLAPGKYVLIASLNKQQLRREFVIYKQETTTEDFIVTSPLPPQQSTAVVEGNALITYLPFIGPNFDYEVTYSYSYAQGFSLPAIIIIAPNSTYQQDALQWIRAVGFDPSVLNIRYQLAQPQPQAAKSTAN